MLCLIRALKSLLQCYKISVHNSPFPILKDETEVLELLVPSEKGKEKNKLIIETCIGKDINCISSIKVIPQNTQRLTQRHDSAASLFSPLHLIISSWLSKNTILACYVYVKFHNKELVQGEILSAMWVVHLVLLCAEEFIFMCITEEKKNCIVRGT